MIIYHSVFSLNQLSVCAATYWLTVSNISTRSVNFCFPFIYTTSCRSWLCCHYIFLKFYLRSWETQKYHCYPLVPSPNFKWPDQARPRTEARIQRRPPKPETAPPFLSYSWCLVTFSLEGSWSWELQPGIKPGNSTVRLRYFNH